MWLSSWVSDEHFSNFLLDCVLLERVCIISWEIARHRPYIERKPPFLFTFICYILFLITDLSFITLLITARAFFIVLFVVEIVFYDMSIFIVVRTVLVLFSLNKYILLWPYLPQFWDIPLNWHTYNALSD